MSSDTASATAVPSSLLNPHIVVMSDKLGRASCPPSVLAEMTAGASAAPRAAARRASTGRRSSLDRSEEGADDNEDVAAAAAGGPKKDSSGSFLGRLREDLEQEVEGGEPRKQKQQHYHHQHHLIQQQHQVASDITAGEGDAGGGVLGGAPMGQEISITLDDSVRSINSGTQARFEGLHRDLDRSKQTLKAARVGGGDATAQTFQARLGGLQRDLDRSKRRLLEKERKLESTEKQRGEIQSELKLVRAKLTKTRKERAILRKGKEKDQDELSTALSEIESARKTLAKTSSARDTELSVLNDELETVREQLEMAEAAADAKARLLSELEDEVKTLNEDKKNQVSTIESLTSQKEAQKDELDEMRKSLSVQREELDRLKSIAEARSAEEGEEEEKEEEEIQSLASSTTELETIKKQKEDLEQAIITISAKRDELMSRQEDQITKMETSKTVVRILQNEIEKLMKEKAAQAKEIEKLSAAKNEVGAQQEGQGSAEEKEGEVGQGAVEDEHWLDIESALKTAPYFASSGSHEEEEEEVEGKTAKRISLFRLSNILSKPPHRQDEEDAHSNDQASPTRSMSLDEVKELKEQLRERDDRIGSLEAAAEENKDTIARLKSDFVLLRSSYKMKEYSSRKEVERLEEEVALLNSELGRDGQQSTRRLNIKAEEAFRSPEKPKLENSNDDSLEKTRTVVETWMERTKDSKNKKEAEGLVENLQAEIVEIKAKANLIASEKDDEIDLLRREKRDMENQVAAVEKAFKTMNTVAKFDPASDPQGAHVVTTVESLERLDQEIGSLRSHQEELEQALRMQTMLLQEEKSKSASLKEALRSAAGDGESPKP